MAERELRYDTTFADFQFLQGYMTRRVAARNRGPHLRALMSVVLCAFFIAMAIVLNVDPYRAITLSGGAVPYPISFYPMLIVLLIGAILALLPAVKLRMKTLRTPTMGPFSVPRISSSSPMPLLSTADG
jgi:hypothetical protein